MTVGGISTTRRCSRCGHRFEIGPAEARSAEAARRKLTCRRCTPTPPPSEGEWRSWSDAELEEHERWLDEHDPGRYVRNRAALSGDVPRSRCDGCGQLRPDEGMHDVAGHQICEACWRNQPGHMPPPSGEAAVRYWHDDGVPVYAPEPSGVPLEDRAYSHRWWAGDGGEYRDIVRTFVDWVAE